MTEQNFSSIEYLKTLDVSDFYYQYDIFERNVAQKKQLYESNNRK